MTVPSRPGSDQFTLWNGPTGRVWVEHQAMIDTLFAPFAALLVDAAVAVAPRAVLDVGCGAGSTTLAVARRLGAGAHYTGIDISDPMMVAAHDHAARQRLPVRFIRADAEAYDFVPAEFDMIISRFGVMFFDDPIRAFANLRRAAQSEAALRFIAWRSPEENPFMTTAERAAAPLVPTMPARVPNAPGQFGFADGRRVRHILEQAGWTKIEVRPIDVPCVMPTTALIPYLTHMGPLGAVLRDTDPAAQARIIQTVRAAFDRYVDGTQIRFTSACWMVAATAP